MQFNIFIVFMMAHKLKYIYILNIMCRETQTLPPTIYLPLLVPLPPTPTIPYPWVAHSTLPHRNLNNIILLFNTS